MFRTFVFLSILAISAPAAAQTRVVPENREQVQLSFAPVVKRAAPAVVNVTTKRTQRTVASPFANDPMFRRFFGDQFPGMDQKVQNSLGSGVIVDPSGIIVTNFHVIRGAEEIVVGLADRREFEASVLRADEKTDLAVLRIETNGEKLPHLDMRDSDDLEVGDIVLAIGNPFGVGQTVTQGIVSALARTMVGISDFRFFIQTDAAINPGNSGGALVTLDGRLVGINSAIFSRDGGSNGIGFAIPSNMVQTVVAGVNSGGRLVRAWLGASGQTVTSELAPGLGLQRPVGVAITDVFAGGPADKAGLRRGDVVLKVEGREVGDNEALRFRIATQPVGQTVRLTVWRGGHETTLPVTLTGPIENPPREVTAIRGQNPFSGATIANLSPAFVEELGIDLPPRGVVVTEVRRGSPADQIRLQPGDVLLRVNDRAIATVEDARKIVNVPLPWRLQIRRGERTLATTVGG
ncbi:MAG: Do family serine endopeptidase [Alphaproteobacteria bacterium]|nr:Do family serine endopeptidase [Alphaproteobacteria bacterium]